MPIELARPDDLSELLDFLFTVFRIGNPEHPRFEAMYPDLFTAPTAETMARHQIIRRDGRIVACVGTYPMTLRIAGCRVPGFGVGQVATAPDMQGRGFMTQLLTAASRRMEAEGGALSWLGGRRDRYGRHGWDMVQNGFGFAFIGTAIRDTNENLLVSSALGTATEITEEMFALRDAATGIEETPESYRVRLGRNESEVWTAICRKTGAVEAWAVIYPKARRIVDFCGSIDGVVQIAKSAALHHGNMAIQVTRADPGLLERLRAECARLFLGSQMMRIVSLGQTLAAYRPLIEAATPPGCGVTLRMARRDAPAEEGAIGKGGRVVELDDKRMARLFFGPERAGDIPGAPTDLHWLNAIFPLPVTIPEFYNV
jgi:predicted N-acetyltransferase YhbS